MPRRPGRDEECSSACSRRRPSRCAAFAPARGRGLRLRCRRPLLYLADGVRCPAPLYKKKKKKKGTAQGTACCFSPPAPALEISWPACSTLAAAHSSASCTAEVSVNVRGTADCVIKVADFGLARAQSRPGNPRSGLPSHCHSDVASPKHVTGVSTGAGRGCLLAVVCSSICSPPARLPFTATPRSRAPPAVTPTSRRRPSLVTRPPRVGRPAGAAATSRRPAPRPADSGEFLLRQCPPGPAGGTERPHRRYGSLVQGLAEAPWLTLYTPSSDRRLLVR